MNIANKLIEFALGEKDLPVNAAHILNLSILDWVSVSLSGVGEPVSKIVRECFLEEGGPVSYTHLTLPTTPYV